MRGDAGGECYNPRMNITRRALAFLLPGVAGAAAAQETKGAKKADTPAPVMTSKGYEFKNLPVRTNANGGTSRAVFNGRTTRGQHITMHISELPPGKEPHPPERQAHDEVIVLREGTLEATLNGQVVRLGPGSIIFSSYNDLNGWKNVGDKPAQYYVVSLEG
jgi:XRE family transcriptional regulator, regulator of sulfur utilization